MLMLTVLSTTSNLPDQCCVAKRHMHNDPPNLYFEDPALQIAYEYSLKLKSLPHALNTGNTSLIKMKFLSMHLPCQLVIKGGD